MDVPEPDAERHGDRRRDRDPIAPTFSV